jgi:hypothetical protein
MELIVMADIEPEQEQNEDIIETWWCITETELMAMLNKVYEGESPDNVYMEAYANADDREWDGLTDD